MSWLRNKLFSGLYLALTPIVVLAIGFVMILRPGLRKGMGERLGGLPQQKPGGVWIHSASMGEARASASLILALERLGLRVMGSCMTQSGRDVLHGLAPDTPIVFAPIDHPWFVARSLDRVQPRALILIETELWPCLILAAKRRSIPVWVASGRLSDASFPRYRRWRWLVGPVFGCLDGVTARSQADADRFAALGVPEERIHVLGDLKLDSAIARAHLATDLVRATSSVPVFVAGSTHAPEEQAVLDALSACERAGCELALVIAPRRPERFAEVERTIRATGRRLHLRSQLAERRLANGEVLLLDSTGELAALYSTAQIAFVGGTLADIGGHNLLEPLIEGCPVVFGPNVENVRDHAALAQRSGAGTPVADTPALITALIEQVANPKDCRARGEVARQFLADRRGCADRTARLLVERFETLEHKTS